MDAQELIEAVSMMTPAAEWREQGKPDPHGGRYDCERAGLILGKLTDDELANAVFMHGDKPLNVAAVLAGEPSPHCYLVAAKDRIRWLSRRTVKLEAEIAALLQRVAELEERTLAACQYVDWLKAQINADAAIDSAAGGGA